MQAAAFNQVKFTVIFYFGIINYSAIPVGSEANP
jgi:hypothetical protein